MKKSWGWLGVLALALLLWGCPEKGPMEKAGEKIDEAAEEVEDAVEDAADEVEDAVDK
jgi:hypothetical protein